MNKIVYLFVLTAFFCVSRPAFSAAPVSYLSAVKSVIEEVRPSPDLKLVRDYIRRVPRVSSSDPIEKTAKTISEYIFDTWKIQPDSTYLSRENKDNILPDSTLATRQAHCLGISILYLLAAESRGVSGFLVRAPDHVFVRYCKGTHCINIEGLKRGAALPDSYYMENLAIPKTSIQNNNYLQNLGQPDELKASIYLGLGYVTGKSGQNDLAELFYKKSAALSSNFAEPHSNLAAVYAALGDRKRLLDELNIALKLNPTHYATLLNIGAHFYQTGNTKTALTYFDRAIAANPVSAIGYRNRAKALVKLGNNASALGDLQRILIIEPKFCNIIDEQIDLLKKLKRTGSETLLQAKSKLQASKECLRLE